MTLITGSIVNSEPESIFIFYLYLMDTDENDYITESDEENITTYDLIIKEESVSLLTITLSCPRTEIQMD